MTEFLLPPLLRSHTSGDGAAHRYASGERARWGGRWGDALFLPCACSACAGVCGRERQSRPRRWNELCPSRCGGAAPRFEGSSAWGGLLASSKRAPQSVGWASISSPGCASPRFRQRVVWLGFSSVGVPSETGSPVIGSGASGPAAGVGQAESHPPPCRDAAQGKDRCLDSVVFLPEHLFSPSPVSTNSVRPSPPGVRMGQTKHPPSPPVQLPLALRLPVLLGVLHGPCRRWAAFGASQTPSGREALRVCRTPSATLRGDATELLLSQ